MKNNNNLRLLLNHFWFLFTLSYMFFKMSAEIEVRAFDETLKQFERGDFSNGKVFERLTFITNRDAKSSNIRCGQLSIFCKSKDTYIGVTTYELFSSHWTGGICKAKEENIIGKVVRCCSWKTPARHEVLNVHGLIHYNKPMGEVISYCFEKNVSYIGLYPEFEIEEVIRKDIQFKEENPVKGEHILRTDGLKDFIHSNKRCAGPECKEVNPVKLLNCGKCLFENYCSKKCQLDDWNFHKKACKTTMK